MALIVTAYSLVTFMGLGDREVPRTQWEGAEGQAFTVDLGRVRELGRVYFFFGRGEGVYRIELSDDGTQWREQRSLRQSFKIVLSWSYRALQGQGRFVRVTVSEAGGMLHEIAVVGSGEEQPLALVAIKPNGGNEADLHNLVDEQGLFRYRLTPGNGAYYDEVVYARAADELVHGLRPYEWVHPPLGKLLIAAGVWTLGLGPFGWRFVVALFGVGLIPLTYALARLASQRRDVAVLAALLAATDFLAFTNSRMASVDVFVSFFGLAAYVFMLTYVKRRRQDAMGVRLYAPLVAAGTSWGAAIACKWSGAFGVMGLAIIFLGTLGRSERGISPRKRRRGSAAGSLRGTARSSGAQTLPSATAAGRQALAVGFISFVAIPATIYVLSYAPVARPAGSSLVETVVIYQRAMLEFHEAQVHQDPWSSKPWEWPIVRRPAKYFGASGPDLPQGSASIIVGMGNPAFWWVGIGAVTLVAARRLRRGDRSLDAALLGLFSCYLPWFLVGRNLYMYHFLPCLPFLAVCVAHVLLAGCDRLRVSRLCAWAYAGLLVALFVLFYPILTGSIVDADYVRSYLEWCDSWKLLG